MQETTWRDQAGELHMKREMFNLPDDGAESALRQRYDRALQQVFGEKGNELVCIRQAKIGRNDPCPCGSGRKFKRCCEAKMTVAVQTAGH